MLDAHFHQGMGLQCQQPQDELRSLVFTSQEDSGKTLSTLWQLCGHLQRLGYPVVVLDATAVETERAPGLLQLLTHAPWADASAHGVHADTSALAVVPAALGMLTLANTAQRKGQAAQTLAALAHQVHGAMGFTQDYPLHLWTRRLWAWREEWGGDAHWARELGTLASRAGPDAYWERLTT